MLVYAPTGPAAGYDDVAPVARSLLALANGNIRHEASLFGIETTIKAKYHDSGPLVGQPVVEYLPTARPFQDVPAAFHEPNARYMVLVVGDYGSSSSWIADDSPGLGNLHNFAPNYGFVSSWSSSDVVSGHGTFLHELGHGLGAVSRNAPHSLPGSHCADGHDVMCYDTWVNNQDYPNANLHSYVLARLKHGTPTHEPVSCMDYRHFDCNHDDYFNPRPGASPLPGILPDDYLLAHWNLADPANLYLRFSTKSDPQASIQAPTTGPTAAVLRFDAAATWDPDGDRLTSLAWDFGDGATAEGAVANHAYSEPGSYEVRLTVYDAYEGRGTANFSVTITPNLAPFASFTGPSRVPIGVAAVFDATPSSDADGSIVSYAWDFGDGSTASGVVATHSFGERGPAQVTLVVTDDSGASSAMTQRLPVTGGAPS
ncbi:MAG TPA: PKD domain-containing protein [Candidatus Thermoplasmatota archaeon]|nr:PKD domain-containing protein [Candidatus Thermoplasmatota archaeon]